MRCYKLLSCLCHNLALILVITFYLTGCCDSESIPRQIQRLYSNSAKDRNDGALSLARCGSKAERAVSRLSQLLYDNNVGVQSAAAYALRKIDTTEARRALDKATERRRTKEH